MKKALLNFAGIVYNGKCMRETKDNTDAASHASGERKEIKDAFSRYWN